MLVFNAVDFAAHVRTKRGLYTLREIGRKTGLSPSTLSRVERRRAPDMQSFVVLCNWLEMSPSAFFQDACVQHKEFDVLEWIELSLRADGALSPEFVDTLMQLIHLFHAKEVLG